MIAILHYVAVTVISQKIAGLVSEWHHTFGLVLFEKVKSSFSMLFFSNNQPARVADNVASFGTETTSTAANVQRFIYEATSGGFVSESSGCTAGVC
jgi:hypothetical protein